VRPTDTANLLLFTLVRGWQYRLKIVIANTSGSAATFRIFHSVAGTTYDETTTLAFDVSLATGARTEFPTDGYILMGSPAAGTAVGNLAVRSSVGSALTFTAYGEREKT
jgi:hypothetical protein